MFGITSILTAVHMVELIIGIQLLVSRKFLVLWSLLSIVCVIMCIITTETYHLIGPLIIQQIGMFTTTFAAILLHQIGWKLGAVHFRSEKSDILARVRRKYDVNLCANK